MNLIFGTVKLSLCKSVESVRSGLPRDRSKRPNWSEVYYPAAFPTHSTTCSPNLPSRNNSYAPLPTRPRSRDPGPAWHRVESPRIYGQQHIEQALRRLRCRIPGATRLGAPAFVWGPRSDRSRRGRGYLGASYYLYPLKLHNSSVTIPMTNSPLTSTLATSKCLEVRVPVFEYLVVGPHVLQRPPVDLPDRVSVRRASVEERIHPGTDSGEYTNQLDPDLVRCTKPTPP